jgi:hypothetical protein
MSAEALLQEIVNERGNLSVLQLAVARQLARLLSRDDADANAITRLESLLPARPDPEAGPSWDLSKLSDREFAALERLHARATGQAPPPRLRKPPPPPETPRTIRARELADLLDKVDSERRQLTDDDLMECRNHLSGLLGTLATLTTLLPVEVYGVPSRSLPAPALQNATEGVAESNTEQPAPIPAPTPPADNVVALENFRYGGPVFGERDAYGDHPRWQK